MSGARDILRALGGTVADVVGRTADPEWHHLLLTALRVAPGAARGALPWLIKAREGREATLLMVVREHAARDPNGLALEMGDERLSWRDVAERAGRFAQVLTEAGVRRGDVVALVGKNSPTYVVLLLAATWVGAVAALINWHLEGAPLDHAIVSSKARIAIAEAGFAETLRGRETLGEHLERILVYGEGAGPEEDHLEALAAASTARPPRPRPVDAGTDFVYIYTSGTTGLPKPCRVSHARALVAGAGFGSLMFRFQPGDKLYSRAAALPRERVFFSAHRLHHDLTRSADGDQRRSFSASAFWDDVHRYRCDGNPLHRRTLPVPGQQPRPTRRERDPTRFGVAVGNGLARLTSGRALLESRFGIEHDS